MKVLINEIIAQINKTLVRGKVNLVKLEDFDSPEIYAGICKELSSREDINLIAKMDVVKFHRFLTTNNIEWEASLNYLKNNNFVDEVNPLTMYRNAAVKLSGTVLLLLMGADAAVDKGSIMDFKRISVEDIVTIVKKDYSKWFENFLFTVGTDINEGRWLIRNIYSSLFKYANIDVLQLSNFIDHIDASSISDIDDLVGEIFSTLNTWWNIPRIENVSYPRSAKKGKKQVDILVAAYEFINRPGTSASKIKQYDKKIDTYANENGISLSAPFNSFSSYAAFKDELIAFLKGERVAVLRQKFLNADFGIIYDILNIKTAGTPKTNAEKIVKLMGEPLEVYFRIITDACKRFQTKSDSADLPNDVIIEVTGIKLSNCLSKEDNNDSSNSVESQYRDICSFLGGILQFINDGFSEKIISNLAYKDGMDPFAFDNYPAMTEKIKTGSKWGEKCQVSFKVNTSSAIDNKVYSFEYRWSFSPFAGWKNAFSLINSFATSAIDNNDRILPLLINCINIIDFVSCESENEFYAKIESMQYTSLSKAFENEIRKTYGNNNAYNKLNLICEIFEDLYQNICCKGLFSSMKEINSILKAYSDMLVELTNTYKELSVSAKEKINYFLDLFTIVGNENYVKDGYANEVIFPAYHPIMLEKIQSQSYYYVYSFVELMNKLVSNCNIDCNKEVSSIKELGAVIQGVDVVPTFGNKLLTCRNVWGYYAIYCPKDCMSDYIGIAEMVDDELEVNEEMSAENTPKIRVIKRNILDYINTFPSRIDGINIAFIAPTEIQYVVEGIEAVAKVIEDRIKDKDITSTLNIKIICFSGNKNVNGYLRYWLDSFLAQERCVKINVSLKYISENKVKELEVLLKNQDICFIYNILDDDGVDFNIYYQNEADENEYRTSYAFPMTFIPDTVSSMHSIKRKVNISQVQFFVSNCYTQFAHKIIRPNNVDGQYKAMQFLSLMPIKEEVLNLAHANCRWVVCEDRAIDRDLLQNRSAKIIGFTTGEGCFGEYNVTISAKEDILDDIKALLKIRLVKRFEGWSAERAESAAQNCINLTKNFDGSRLLRALNQRDYEIHNFLAYALTVQSLNIGSEEKDKYIARSLLNMDSYHHWFTDDEYRPDFLLIEIFKSDVAADRNKPIKLCAKVIECKMSTNVDALIDKAKTQVEVGLSSLMEHWNPNSHSVNRRYWFTQLYRALAFSKLMIDDGGDIDYTTINSKIFEILNGNFEIEWSGAIYAYALNANSSDFETTSLPSDLLDNGIELNTAGQIYIQKMILPAEKQQEGFVYTDIPEFDVYEQYDEETDTVQIDDEDIDERELVPAGGIITEPISKPVSNADETVQRNESAHTTPITESGDEKTNDVRTDVPVVNPDKKPLSEVRVLLGKDNTGREYYWEYGNKQLNNRHLLINGNSGYGKTYCIQGLLMDLSRQGVPSIIFDYTGGFMPSKLEPTFKDTLGEKIVQRIVRISKIPINPFVRGTIVIDEDFSVPEGDNDVANRVKSALNNVYRFGDQQQSVIYQAVLDGMKTYGEAMSFNKLRDILTDMDSKYTDSVINKITPFIDMEPFVTGENFNWDDIRSSDGTVFIFQLAGYERENQLLLTELLLRDLWSFAQNRGDKNKPFVVVLDEAQNLRHNAESPSGKILTEGRKFGVSGWYATQFMGGQLEKDEIQCLQQAAQKLYFCPPDNGVMDTAKSIDISPQGSKEWAEKLKRLKLGECVTCGSMVINDRFTKYPPRQIKAASLEERLNHG